ncbi:MAG TPA: NHL repeat-containing protein [Verrucomicrobiae bacterium]|nr:NHL repeat-containing protein [Verrucomicrobiae bacterium]
MKAKLFLLTALFFAAPLFPARSQTIYVSSFSVNTIDKFDSAGNGSVFATASSGLSDPDGLALDKNGDLFVANFGSNIEEFSPSGSGSVFAATSGVFTGLAFDNQGNLYASDGSQILKFDSMGNESVFVSTNLPFQDYGFDAGLAFGPDGDLFASFYDGSILKFNSNGVSTVFASGVLNPQGLAFDASGNLYVASTSRQILKFSPTGQESIFASNFAGAFPLGLGFDSSGNLYATRHTGSFGQDQIMKFNPAGVGTVFASHLDNAIDIAIENIPEPSSPMLTMLGVLVLCAIRKRRTR